MALVLAKALFYTSLTAWNIWTIKFFLLENSLATSIGVIRKLFRYRSVTKLLCRIIYMAENGLVSYYSAKKKQFAMSLKYDFFIYSTIFSGHRNFLSIKQIFINLVGWKAIAERNITGGNIFSKRIKFEKLDLIFFFWSWKFSFFFWFARCFWGYKREFEGM